MSEKLTIMRLGEGLDKSRTDWDRLEAMSDDDIDTSDIPELDDDFLKTLRVVMPPEKKHVGTRADADAPQPSESVSE